MIDNAVKRLARMRSKPWLILGKGPSLDLRCHFDLDQYHTLSLNHACRVHRVTVAHFTDLEAFWDCATTDLVATESAVAMPYTPNVVFPYVPHIHMQPGHYNLTELIDDVQDKNLRVLSEADRLWSYNSSRVPRKRWHPDLTTVQVRYFSAVPAFNLLAMAGHKKIYTLGIDGGKDYADAFHPRDKLANGRDSFDIQFVEIQRTLKRYGVVHINLVEKL